jgi:hypothetical protein
MGLWGKVMDITEFERKHEELRTGAENLKESMAESGRAWEFILAMLTEHNAESVGNLPLDIQTAIAARMRNLKPDGWEDEESKRLDALAAEFFLLIPPADGPVN